jgi:NAD(P)-dependent dehydrogenase (short-subunit alcohol dehydrogenase family)
MDIMSSCRGKVVVVTGAATGIGAATARLFGEKGAALVLVDVNRDAGRATAESVQGTGAKAVFVEADVSSEDDVKKATDRALEAFGRIDVLINNAGIMRRHTRLEDWPLDEIRRVLDVNLMSLFITTHTIAPLMGRTGGGVIINISSYGALLPVTYSPCYAASKAGVLALTRSLVPALEAHKVRVNALLPNLVDTPLTAGSPARSLYPESIMQPEDVARAILSIFSSRVASGAFFVVQKTVQGPRLFSVTDVPALTEFDSSGVELPTASA